MPSASRRTVSMRAFCAILRIRTWKKIGIPLGHRKKYRHGKIRYYYRRDGKQIALPFEPGTTELQQA